MKMKLLRDLSEWLNPQVVRDTTNDRLREPVPKPSLSWEAYKDKKGEWRWRVTAANGEIIGASTEGYKSKAACINNLKRLTKLKVFAS